MNWLRLAVRMESKIDEVKPGCSVSLLKGYYTSVGAGDFIFR